MFPKTEFDALFREAGFSGDLYEPFSRYCYLLQEWNQRMNLTAITGDREVFLKHFLDSLLPLTLWELPRGARLIDVGTGAGFPGMVLKILEPSLSLTLVDSLGKRLVWLETVDRKSVV